MTPFLQAIEVKVRGNIRLTAEEGLALLKTEEEEEKAFIGQLANEVRKKKAGEEVIFACSLYIHPTNLCELNCPLCSFYAKPGWKSAWFMTPEEVEKKILQFYPKGLTEIHIVGGLWRDCNLPYYEDLFRRIKAIDPQLHIKALTPVEYDFLAKLHGISCQEVLQEMKKYGLGSLPGGGAEVLVEEIRQKIAPGKISSDEYLNIHKMAHSLGIHSNITMLFGHIEREEDLITHLVRVRTVQDETQGFRTFIPLKFSEQNNALGKRKNQLKPKDCRLVYAVSRLMLDNIAHLKVLWNYVGVDEALEILNWGANDLSSTNLEEKIISMAKGVQVKMDKETMSALIEKVGRIPRLTHTGNV